MRVVPALDPFEHGHPGFRLALEAPAVEKLPLKGGKLWLPRSLECVVA
jgi:hypothetical protein